MVKEHEFLAKKEIDVAELKPTFRRVLIEIPEANKKVGGLFIPESSRENAVYDTRYATVIAQGFMAFEGCPEKPQIGDTVLINSNCGSMFEFDGKKYRLINDSDILAF